LTLPGSLSKLSKLEKFTVGCCPMLTCLLSIVVGHQSTDQIHFAITAGLPAGIGSLKELITLNCQYCRVLTGMACCCQSTDLALT
jgi:hypothetical protein